MTTWILLISKWSTGRSLHLLDWQDLKSIGAKKINWKETSWLLIKGHLNFKESWSLKWKSLVKEKTNKYWKNCNPSTNFFTKKLPLYSKKISPKVSKTKKSVKLSPCMSTTPLKKSVSLWFHMKRCKENLLITFRWQSSLRKKTLCLSRKWSKFQKKTSFLKATWRTFMSN